MPPLLANLLRSLKRVRSLPFPPPLPQLPFLQELLCFGWAKDSVYFISPKMAKDYLFPVPVEMFTPTLTFVEEGAGGHEGLYEGEQVSAYILSVAFNYPTLLLLEGQPAGTDKFTSKEMSCKKKKGSTVEPV